MSGRWNIVRILTGLFVIAFIFGAASAQATTRIKGTLYSVNSTSPSITIKTGGSLMTIPLSANTRFVRNKVDSTFLGMVVGDKTTVVYKTSLYPAKVKTAGAAVSLLQGKVTGVSPGGAVSVGGILVSTSFRTKVVRNGGVASLDSLTTDDDVTVHVEDESGEAEDIQSEGPEESEVSGTITAVDVAGGMVTIQDAASNLVTVSVNADTMIEVNDAVATINELLVGMVAEAEYDPLTFAAFRVESESTGQSARIDGAVTAVDAAGGMVTIQDALGNSITVIADAATQIVRDDQPAFLSDILVGDTGSAEYDVNTFVASEIEAESPETGDDSLSN